jgi:hypothetical protein
VSATGEAAAGEASPAANIADVTADSSTTAANRRMAASFGILSPYGSELQWAKAHGTVAVRAVAPVFGEVLSLLTDAVNRRVALMKPSRKVCLAWMKPTAGQAEAINQETAQDPSVAGLTTRHPTPATSRVLGQFRSGSAASLDGT